MSFQPADKKSSKDLGALQQDVNAASDDAYELEPSLFSAVQADINQENNTNWLFYFNCFNEIVSRRTAPNGDVRVGPVLIGGNTIKANPIVLAAVQYNSSPRLFYFDLNSIIREVKLTIGSEDKWNIGSLSANNWRAYPYSGLTATAEHLPTGIFIRIRFHDDALPYKWTQVDYIGSGKWVRQTL
ncbi:hypothetical protein MMC31_005163 [Peltigera leucophlebia]|nr:hypothetical protein [Peltigera leucophlebia]